MNNDIPLPPTQKDREEISKIIPAPRTPGISFLRVISFIALLVSVISFVSFISAVADFTFPSSGFNTYNPYEDIRSSLPIFVASFIALMFSLALLRYKRVKAHDVTYSTPWRRFLYTIFTILGIWMLSGLVYIITAWLDGDLVLRSIIKAIASLVVIGVIVFYYAEELKGVWVENTTKHIKYLGGVSLATVIVIISSFFFIGSPSFHRNIANDLDRRLMVENIQSGFDCGCLGDVLPQNNKEFVDLLKKHYYIASDYTDLSNKKMTYNKIDENSYELCPNFDFDSQTLDNYISKYNQNYSSDIDWSYQKGGCQKIDFNPKEPDVYPDDETYQDTEGFPVNTSDATTSPSNVGSWLSK